MGGLAGCRSIDDDGPTVRGEGGACPAGAASRADAIALGATSMSDVALRTCPGAGDRSERADRATPGS
jgi:hypothetical protein